MFKGSCERHARPLEPTSICQVRFFCQSHHEHAVLRFVSRQVSSNLWVPLYQNQFCSRRN